MADYDTSTINLSTIKQLKISFDQEVSKFKNTTYNTFSSSYLKTCSDPNVSRMATKLENLYKKIEHGYNSIDKWWESYNENAQGLEKFLAGNSHGGSITESSLRSFLTSKFFDLEDFKIDYSGTFNKNVTQNTQIFINNKAASYFVDDSRGVVSGLSTFSAISNVGGVAAVTTQKSYDLSEVTETIGAYASSAKSKVDEWFSNAGEGISNALSSVGSWFSGAGKTIKNKTDEIVSEASNALSEVGAAISNGAESVWNEAKVFFSHDLPIIGEMIIDGLWDGLQKTGATIAVVVQSLVQGLALFGEAIYDVLTLAGGVVATVFTGIADLGMLIAGEDAHFTKDLWNDVKAEVSKQYVNGLFADINASAYGQWLSEYSYIAPDGVVAKVLTGVGYITGVIALTVATCGVGGVAMSGTAATVSVGTTSASITYGSIVGGSIAGLAGVGKNTEVAWNDGADILEGLGYGAAMGAWEGVQYFIGGNINQLKAFTNPTIASNIGNSLVRAYFDGFGGFSEAVVMPAMQSIYKDESYMELFNANGGLKYAFTNATLGAAFSMISEGGDLVSTKIKTKIDAKEVEIKAQAEAKEIEEIYSSIVEVDAPRMSSNTYNLGDEYGGIKLPQSIVDSIGKDKLDMLNDVNVSSKDKYGILEKIVYKHEGYSSSDLRLRDYIKDKTTSAGTASMHAAFGEYDTAVNDLKTVLSKNEELFKEAKKATLDDALKNVDNVLSDKARIKTTIALLEDQGYSKVEAIHMLSDNKFYNAEKIMLNLDEFNSGHAIYAFKDGNYRIISVDSVSYFANSKKLISELNAETNSFGKITLEEKFDKGVLVVCENGAMVKEEYQRRTKILEGNPNGFRDHDSVYTNIEAKLMSDRFMKNKADYYKDESARITTHEYLHLSCDKNALMVIKDGKRYTSFNEGVTEYLASKLHNLPIKRGKCTYENNSVLVQMLDSAFESQGHKNVIADCYFRGDIEKMSKAINYYGGDEAFDFMLEQMQKIEHERKAETLKELMDEFQDKIIKPILMGR